MAEKKLLTIDESAELFKIAIDRTMTFEGEQRRTDFLLDVILEFKKAAKEKWNQ